MSLHSMRFLTVRLMPTVVAHAVYHVLPRKSPTPISRRRRCEGLVCLDLHSTNKPCEALRQAKLASLPPTTRPHISLCVLMND
jgi:hypothetical protein